MSTVRSQGHLFDLMIADFKTLLFEPLLLGGYTDLSQLAT